MPYNIFENIDYEAVKQRNEFGVGEYTPIEFDSILLSQRDMTLLSFPMEDRVCAVCAKDDANKVIAVNSKHTLGRQRYSLAHEIYHLYVQRDFTFSICLESDKKPETEKLADAFASHFLMPREAMFWFLEKKLYYRLEEIDKLINLEDVIRLEQYYKISHAALLWRLLNERVISQEQVNSFKDDVMRIAKAIGFGNDLYRVPEQQNKANGKYVSMAEKLHDLSIVSDREYDEYLVDVGIN
jgi:Zn-dependent peptidase ImmA (M78 family)